MYSELPKWTLSTNPLLIQSPCTRRTRLANPGRTGNHIHDPRTESLASDENGLPHDHSIKSNFSFSSGPISPQLRRKGGGCAAAVWKGSTVSLTVPDKNRGTRLSTGSGKSTLLDASAGGERFTNGQQQTRAFATSVPEGEQIGEEIGRAGTCDIRSPILKKPRLLCLHGYRTSAIILQKQLQIKWPESVLGRLDLHFINAPFLARGKSNVENHFDPPYYEWFQRNEDYSDIYNFEEAIAYIEDYMIKHGPFDGLLGFSQGGMIAAAVPGMQSNGVVFTRVPKIKHLIIICGGKFGGSTASSNGYLGSIPSPQLAAGAFSSPIKCPSLHFIGAKDTLMGLPGTELLESFEDPFVIKYRYGHTVIRPDAKALQTMLSFIEKIEKM